MQALLLATRPTENLSTFPTAHDLAHLLEQPSIRSNTALWWSGNTLAAYALLIDGEVHTDALPEEKAKLRAELESWRKALGSKPQRVLEVA